MDENGYRSLAVWKRARALAIEVCHATAGHTFKRDWALKDQLRRSAISVPSNIAEGSERGSNRDSIRFLYFARGSLAELATQADIACEIGLLDAGVAAQWLAECDSLGRMIIGLIHART